MIRLKNFGLENRFSARHAMAFSRLAPAFLFGIFAGLFLGMNIISFFAAFYLALLHLTIFASLSLKDFPSVGIELLLKFHVFLTSSFSANLIFSRSSSFGFLLKIGQNWSHGSLYYDFLLLAFANLILSALFYYYFFISSTDFLLRVPLSKIVRNEEADCFSNATDCRDKKASVVIAILYPISLLNLFSILVLFFFTTMNVDMHFAALGIAILTIFSTLGIFLTELLRLEGIRRLERNRLLYNGINR